jgi:hypothetical protein
MAVTQLAITLPSANFRTLTGALSLRVVFLGAGVGRLVEAPEGVS